MKHRSLVLSLIFVLFVALFLPAQTAPLPTNTRLAEILRLSALQTGDWQALFSMAESGDPEAQYWLGRIYEAGRLLTLDKEKSAYWYQKSADQGYAPAEYSVCGKRAKQDSLENERCLWRAAEKGVAEAQFWLGVAFDQHLWFGVTDEQEALKWFRRAAEQGNPRQPIGFVKRPNMFRIWAVRGREETIWEISLWRVTEFRRITCRPTCGYPWQAATIALSIFSAK